MFQFVFKGADYEYEVQIQKFIFQYGGLKFEELWKSHKNVFVKVLRVVGHEYVAQFPKSTIADTIWLT